MKALNPLEYVRAKMKVGRIKEAPGGAKRDPKKVQVKKVGQAIKGGGGGGDFEDSPVDLEEIGKAYYTDSYIRRAVDKYAGLMFKNDWELQGKNDAALEYLDTRFKLIAEATGSSMEEMLMQLANDYVLYGNAYLVKARQKGSQAGATGVKAVGYTSNQPVAGYFVLAPTTVTVSRDEFGKILKYQQSTSGGQGVEYKPEDIIHFAYHRPTGRAYGVPFIFNALDDVKILRQIEENVARLIYRNLFPLYMYQVGSEKPGFEATDEEIDAVREEIRDMPMDGGIVVPERHNIQVIGAEGNAIDANGYLKYFRQRVFTGLGVSDSVMGVGDSANKSTSDNQSADLNDAIKEFQRGFAEIMKTQVINEILFEGGFDPVVNPDDEVKFLFSEIELDAKIKKENHIIQMFTQNAITHEEMRMMMGLEPVPDENRLQANMFMKVDQGAAAQGDNKDQPANQHGKKQSPGKPNRKNEALSEKNNEKVLTEANEVVTLTSELDVFKYTSILEDYWNKAKSDVVNRVARGESMKIIPALTTRLIHDMMKNRNRQYLEKAIVKGFRNGREQVGFEIPLAKREVEKAIQKGQKSIDKVITELEEALQKASEIEEAKRIAYIESAFHANKYRLRLISKTMLYAAYNHGVGLAGNAGGIESMNIVSNETACKTCESQIKTIELTGDWLSQLPPHHPGCECYAVLNVKQ